MRGTRVELWLRGPDGQYDDVHRGTVITDGNGRYRFESNFPGGGAPHIHVRVAAPGYRPLATVYFPRSGAVAGVLDLVLEPEV
jgi:protocatechuate 3,4-dioxygenase beta subunit